MLHTIQIDGNDYTSYSTVAAADIRLSVDVVRRTTWNAATEADQGRALIAASDRIDAFRFIGDPAVPGQPRKWPRSGVPDVADNAIPSAVELATQLLAGDILENPEAGRPRNPTAAIGSISKVKAGSVEVDYYTGAHGLRLTTRQRTCLARRFNRCSRRISQQPRVACLCRWPHPRQTARLRPAAGWSIRPGWTTG